MTPKKKRAKISKPIPLDRALKIYSVNSEYELMKVFQDKFDLYEQKFLSNKPKSRFGFLVFWKKSSKALER